MGCAESPFSVLEFTNNEVDGGSLSRTANPVNVVVDCFRRVKVDYCTHRSNVQTSACDISRNQIFDKARSEFACTAQKEDTQSVLKDREAYFLKKGIGSNGTPTCPTC